MKRPSLSRRKFVTILGAGGALLAANPEILKADAKEQPKPKPATNIADASKTPRKAGAMPGLFPGKVVQVSHAGSVVDNEPVEAVAY
ncbi:MAG: hypothetical protein JXB49_33940, partial [Bacteroidales bacterium]|nr:hypothetical protein [Bacteroidales bacterium]